MKNKPIVVFHEVFQVRKLNQPPDITNLGTVDFTTGSEFVCNEISMDRAMAVADKQALVDGKLCVIIPMMVSHIDK